ncbi:uncharacterized protein LOC133187787 isoform X2 [Saccostrea echinata]|uniref:uncharacterized protein LOC133187787 isoform X2 n=1 Tax=Saccostrea echinata TaxID=191078 RepID=UPI002A7FCD5A|nr:uncharacterized protein LOC133187787 isoform X2 [Saccostrea echinata]
MTNCYEVIQGFRECCSGYKWDENFKNCTKCIPGYFGVNCAQSCKYPSFGDGCQQECKCREEECSVAWGCTEKITTQLYTTKQTTMKFGMSTENGIFVSIITEKGVVNHTSGESVMPKATIKSSDTLFTTRNLLMMGIFGVGLILVTLFVVFTCKFICKKLSSKRRLRLKTNASCPISVQEEIHYEEISNISPLPNTRSSYSPLEQNESEGQNKIISMQDSKPLLENQLEEFEMEIAKEDYENTINSAVPDPQNQQVPLTVSGLTDLEGYQLPHSTSFEGANGSMEGDHRVMEETHCNEINDYLTVIPHNIQQ